MALFVTDTELPDAPVLEAFHQWRTVVPAARRIIAAHWAHFLDRAPALRPGMARSMYDAYLLMPRGVRDEEFHGAVTELLSDWGSTVAKPETPAASSSPGATIPTEHWAGGRGCGAFRVVACACG